MSVTFPKVLPIALAVVTMAAISLSAHAPVVQKSTDASIKDRIDYGLETSALVRKYAIDVKVTKGEATLTGKVSTEAQKAEAERVAKIAGASRIQNLIAVDPDADKTVADRVKAGVSKTGEKITDVWITAKVKWFFAGDDLLKGSHINVDVADHVVTLKGTVKSEAGRARAVSLASDTDGVKRVIDMLTVAR